MKPGKVVVIGAGAAGLSAAWTLKKRGVDVMVLEASDQIGGRMGGARVDGFSVDNGADFFPGSYDVAFRLCKELGMPLKRIGMNIGWYRNGRWAVTKAGRSVDAVLSNAVAARTPGSPVAPGISCVDEAGQGFQGRCKVPELRQRPQDRRTRRG